MAEVKVWHHELQRALQVIELSDLVANAFTANGLTFQLTCIYTA